MFVTPGIIAGGLLSIPALHLIFYYAFENTLGLKMSPYPTAYAIYNALFVGLVIPFVASIIPIQEALGKNLIEALDITRSKTKAIMIKVLTPGR